MVKIKKSLVNFAAVFIVALMLVQTSLAAGRNLVPVGDVVGINIEMDGVLVVGFSDDASPAKAAGIKAGDIIIELGGIPVSSGEDIRNADFGAESVAVTVMRSGIEKQITVKPRVGQDGEPELGVCLRDGLSGIGTVTFYDPETGVFGALGHGVNDMDTGVIIPVREGAVSEAEVSDVIEGRCGVPGQLSGVFDFDTVVGIVNDNCMCGIFGIITDAEALEMADPIETADADEISTGHAVIISCVDEDGPREFDVEITKVDIGNKDGHSFVIKVTDEELLEKTGGIVQGMSGSPIIQNGKLVGAVTHVLVNDPTRGYGIFIENMLDAAA